MKCCSEQLQESSLSFEIRNEVRPFLLLLDACEDHLGPRHVLLGVDEVLEHVLVRPNDARVLVGLGVREGCTARLSSKDPVERRTLLRNTASFEGVALRTLGLEDLCALLASPSGTSTSGSAMTIVPKRWCENH